MQGDSGGPLMVRNSDQNYSLAGVTSFGVGDCGESGHPAVYTAVSSYIDWINKTINEYIP